MVNVGKRSTVVGSRANAIENYIEILIKRVTKKENSVLLSD
jgi:hypothetical protein